MRLRLMDGSDELAVIELDSAEALAEVLSHIQSEYGDRLQTAASLHYGVLLVKSDTIVSLNSRTLQPRNHDIVPESDRCRDVARSRMHRWIGLEH